MLIFELVITGFVNSQKSPCFYRQLLPSLLQLNNFKPKLVMVPGIGGITFFSERPVEYGPHFLALHAAQGVFGERHLHLD